MQHGSSGAFRHLVYTGEVFVRNASMTVLHATFLFSLERVRVFVVDRRDQNSTQSPLFHLYLMSTTLSLQTPGFQNYPEFSTWSTHSLHWKQHNLSLASLEAHHLFQSKGRFIIA